MSKIEQHNLSPESPFISDIITIIEQGWRMAYASVTDLEIWHTCAPNLTCTRPLPILQTRLRNLRMKVIDELCVQKMHICFWNSATSGCTMPRFTAGYGQWGNSCRKCTGSDKDDKPTECLRRKEDEQDRRID